MDYGDRYGHIVLEGAANVRDLGGHRLPGGGELARGRLLRADALNALTGADLDRLAPLGLRTVIDFRMPSEIELNGGDRLPAGAELVPLPVGGGNLDVFYEVILSGDAARQEETFGGGRTEHVLAEVNRAFVAIPQERAQFTAALRRAADAPSLPLLFHCTAGKDRTGWMAAIVLTVMGVPRDEIMADYLRSNDYHRAGYDLLLRQLGETGQMKDPELLRPLLEQRPAYLEAAFDEADRRYGSFDRFLADGLDLDPAALDALRANLTG
ncbi:tyrosine-protein phosphatase [Spirillospora sp. NPDC047279]|uniref:tyrosine-protein phosphatase n=1 Tax=Spirillospora sp. NPDC047279 TaxID=3155478 RepID=UPI0033F1CFD7